MRITLVTHYYPPEVNAPAQRAFDHARFWTQAGCKVTILTAQPSHPYGRVYDGYANATSEEVVDGVRIVRLKTVLGANSGRVRRSMNYASFLQAVYANAWRARDADVVISTSPQFFCGLSGRAVAAAAHAPWVLEIRDVWPESIIAVGAAKPSLATSALSALADIAYSQCDRIISVSPGFARHFRDRGVPDEKVSLVPNGIDFSADLKQASFDDFPALASLRGRTIAAYVGTLGMAHGVSTILEAAAHLKENKRLGFLLVGSGAERNALIAKRDALGLDNIVILDQLPRSEIERLFALVGICIVHLKKQDVFKTVIPTKLLEGMAMAKPVALGVGGVARDILEAANGGLSFEPENALGLVKTLLSLAGDTAAARAMGESGRSHVRANYNRQTLAMRYLGVLEDVRQRWSDR